MLSKAKPSKPVTEPSEPKLNRKRTSGSPARAGMSSRARTQPPEPPEAKPALHQPVVLPLKFSPLMKALTYQLSAVGEPRVPTLAQVIPPSVDACRLVPSKPLSESHQASKRISG